MTDELLNPVYPIIDGHNDTLLHLTFHEEGASLPSFFDREGVGHVDLPRARQGHLQAGFFAVYVRPDPTAEGPIVEQRYALAQAMKMIAKLYEVEAESKGQIRVVRTLPELRSCLSKPTLGAILHLEGADPIDTDLDALKVLYQAGLRSVGITWSRANAFAQGVPLKFPGSPNEGPGLIGAGKALVRACNELGVMVDVSHLNEQGFWDVVDISQAPVVATHSCAYSLCHSPRNLTNKQLDAIAASGGMVGVNFYVGFLRWDGERNADTPISRIVDHIDHMVKHMGIEHVGLGSDFDGAVIPQELGDVAGLVKLSAALRKRGYGDAELRKISHENWLRVLAKTWKG